MQALKNNLLKKSSNFHKTNFASFSAHWTSNSMTGEAFARHVNQSNNYVNGWSVFNRSNVKTKAKVQYNLTAKGNQTKDFPDIAQKIAFLTGGKGKL
jgi:hypothetical protein